MEWNFKHNSKLNAVENVSSCSISLPTFICSDVYYLVVCANLLRRRRVDIVEKYDVDSTIMGRCIQRDESKMWNGRSRLGLTCIKCCLYTHRHKNTIGKSGISNWINILRVRRYCGRVGRRFNASLRKFRLRHELWFELEFKLNHKYKWIRAPDPCIYLSLSSHSHQPPYKLLNFYPFSGASNRPERERTIHCDRTKSK